MVPADEGYAVGVADFEREEEEEGFEGVEAAVYEVACFTVSAGLPGRGAEEGYP